MIENIIERNWRFAMICFDIGKLNEQNLQEMEIWPSTSWNKSINIDEKQKKFETQQNNRKK